MESVLFIGIDIKVIAWDEDAQCGVAEDWLEVPPAVDAQRVEDYVISRFGEPVDVAVGRTDRFGEIVMGWVFPTSHLERVGLPSEGLEMMVVPFVRFPDGTRRELFEYNAELNGEFAALAALIDPDAPAIGDTAPDESHGRLDTEDLHLVSGDPEEIELQLEGWLRRMLAEGWTYLILELPETGRYVQFLTHDGDWLRGEVVGDRYLGAHAPLSADEKDRLRDLGWNPPDDDDPGEDGDGCGNYWIDWGRVEGEPDPGYPFDEDVTDRDVEEAARFAATALCSVFGPVGPDDVAVMVGAASTD